MSRLLEWTGNNSEEVVLKVNKVPTTFYSDLGVGETVQAQVRGFNEQTQTEDISWFNLSIRGSLIALAQDNNLETLQGPLRIRWVRSIGTITVALGDPYDP